MPLPASLRPTAPHWAARRPFRQSASRAAGSARWRGTPCSRLTCARTQCVPRPQWPPAPPAGCCAPRATGPRTASSAQPAGGTPRTLRGAVSVHQALACAYREACGTDTVGTQALHVTPFPLPPSHMQAQQTGVIMQSSCSHHAVRARRRAAASARAAGGGFGARAGMWTTKLKCAHGHEPPAMQPPAPATRVVATASAQHPRPPPHTHTHTNGLTRSP